MEHFPTTYSLKAFDGLFGGEEVTVNDYDGVPVKNHLPPALGVKYKTKRQWGELGIRVLPGARAVYMHPSMAALKTFVYYHEDDTDAASLGERQRDRFNRGQARLLSDLDEATGHGGLRTLYEDKDRR